MFDRTQLVSSRAPAGPQPQRHGGTVLEPPEIVEADSPAIACDGGGGALGHPRVFLNMGERHEIDCPYCGRRFVLADRAAPPDH